MRLIGFITEPATVRQILAHAGEPTTAPAIAPARSPPVEVTAQQLIAPEAVEAIPELEFEQLQTSKRKLDTIGWWLMRVRVRMRMQSWSRNWSLIRRWDGNPALEEWHTRRSIGRRGPAAGRAHQMSRAANAGRSKWGNLRLLR